jgi:hypothetical protein
MVSRSTSLPKGVTFFKNFPFRTFVSLRILDPPGEILKNVIQLFALWMRKKGYMFFSS